MNEMAPLLPILLVWLCFGLLFRKLQSAAKKAQPANKKAVSPKPDSPAEKKPSAPVPDSSLASMQGSLPIAERLSQPYLGSLGVETGEGEDPCHEEQFHHAAVPMGMHDQPYLGSLGIDTSEGTDPCHEDQLQPILPFAQKEEDGEQPVSGLSWTGNDIVRGFIVSEVLSRKNRFPRVG